MHKMPLTMNIIWSRMSVVLLRVRDCLGIKTFVLRCWEYQSHHDVWKAHKGDIAGPGLGSQRIWPKRLSCSFQSIDLGASG